VDLIEVNCSEHYEQIIFNTCVVETRPYGVGIKYSKKSGARVRDFYPRHILEYVTAYSSVRKQPSFILTQSNQTII
jgi:hypothetical protein